MNKQLQLIIGGMSCGHCEKNVSQLINEQKGVISSSVSLTGHSAMVIIDETIITPKQLIHSINESGIYSAQLK